MNSKILPKSLKAGKKKKKITVSTLFKKCFSDNHHTWSFIILAARSFVTTTKILQRGIPGLELFTYTTMFLILNYIREK